MSEFVCAFCGKSGSSAMSCASGTCTKNPAKCHKVIRAQPRYSCRYCGKSGSSAMSMASGTCPKNPLKYHEAMD